MLSLGRAQLDRLRHRTKSLCHLIKVVRKDGEEYKFTDIPHIVNFLGEDYTPVGSGSISAEQRDAHRESTVDFIGALSTSLITADDIRTGKFRNADLFLHIIDWKQPWLEALYTGWKRITKITHTGTSWTAEVVGRTWQLQRDIGRRYLRDCDYVLGDAATCKATLSVGTHIIADVVVNTVSEDRTEWTATVGSLASKDDDWWKDGQVVWTVGSNEGEIGVVARYIDSTRTIRVFTPFSTDIEVGDEFTITAGCDGLTGTCRVKFNNLLNHGGDPLVRSTEDALAYPDD